MLKKVNQIYNFKLFDNKLVKHHGNSYYLTFQGTNQEREVEIALTNNYKTMKRPHSWIYQEATDFIMLPLIRKKYMLINVLGKL